MLHAFIQLSGQSKRVSESVRPVGSNSKPPSKEKKNYAERWQCYTEKPCLGKHKPTNQTTRRNSKTNKQELHPSVIGKVLIRNPRAVNKY